MKIVKSIYCPDTIEDHKTIIDYLLFRKPKSHRVIFLLDETNCICSPKTFDQMIKDHQIDEDGRVI
jgi:hypothetical protein